MTDLDACTIFGFLFVGKTFEYANQQTIAKNIKRDVRLRRETGGWVNLASVGSDSDSDSDWGSGEGEEDEAKEE